jgi:hypothetical protein
MIHTFLKKYAVLSVVVLGVSVVLCPSARAQLQIQTGSSGVANLQASEATLDVNDINAIFVADTVASSSAGISCEETPSCTALGYTQSSDSCTRVIKCPFDTSYQICLDRK